MKGHSQSGQTLSFYITLFIFCFLLSLLYIFSFSSFIFFYWIYWNYFCYLHFSSIYPSKIEENLSQVEFCLYPTGTRSRPTPCQYWLYKNLGFPQLFITLFLLPYYKLALLYLYNSYVNEHNVYAPSFSLLLSSNHYYHNYIIYYLFVIYLLLIQH